MFLCVIVFKNGFVKSYIAKSLDECAKIFDGWQIDFYGNKSPVKHYGGTGSQPNHIYVYWGLEQ